MDGQYQGSNGGINTFIISINKTKGNKQPNFKKTATKIFSIDERYFNKRMEQAKILWVQINKDINNERGEKDKQWKLEETNGKRSDTI